MVVEHSDSECVSLQKCIGAPWRADVQNAHTDDSYPHVCIGSLSLAADTDGSAATDHG